MKRLMFAATLTVFACAGTDQTATTHDEHPDIYVPGQEGRIDGSVWEDGMFNSPDAKTEFCTNYPDAWFCLGTAEQAWTSVEHHGKSLNGNTCYGPAAPSNDDCVFPAKKKFKVIVQTTGCFVGAPPPAGPSTLQEQAMLDGMRNAALEWDNKGGIDVCMSGVAGCGGADYMDVVIDCAYPASADPNGLASGGLTGTATVKVGNAPVGGNSGKDVDDLIVLPAGAVHINTANTWTAIKACYTSPTESNIKSWVRWTGVHEFGHNLGFSHFNTGIIMNPFRPSGCSPSVAIHQSLADALSTYNPDSSGTSVPLGQLFAQNPL